MDLATGPAALGGMMMWVALGAWTLGRWQDGARPDGAGAGEADPACPAGGAPRPCVPCQDAARAERDGALAAAGSLGAVHAEMTAYRRAAQVLAAPGPGAWRLAPPSDAAQDDCRYLGLTGEPTCGIAGTQRDPCGRGAPCGSPAGPAAAAVQPSAPPFDLTRV